MTGSAIQYGVISCGTYLPRWRVARKTISEAIGWAKGMSASGKGERTFAHWDEDCITMAVEAGRTALSDSANPESVQLASTSLPFADRSNAGLVREALNLDSSCRPFDISGSRRGATSALAQVLQGQNGQHLLIASDCVDARPGSESELLLGHGAAAVFVGPVDEGNDPQAICLASCSFHEDFVDQYRMADQRFDYRLESRWIRDAGTRGQVAKTVESALASANLSAEDVDYFVLPAPEAVSRSVARDCGLENARRALVLDEKVGQCAAAQPYLGLAWALEEAEPDQIIVLLGLGQGVDVLVFKVTKKASSTSLAAQIEKGHVEENYSRYLGLRRLMEIDGGIRSERDNRTAMSAHFRRHDQLTGFIGGRCTHCGHIQFPRTSTCVECRAEGEQEEVVMTSLKGTVNSYTEDWLAYSPRPPLTFGVLHFEGGASLTAEFADFLPGEAEVGQEVRMAFRIKDFDERRGFQRYFWKPVATRVTHG